MKNKNIIIVILLVLGAILTTSLQSIKKAECNYVPNEQTAIKIAEAILVPVYGEKILEKRPFTAILIEHRFWRVEGTINADELGGVPIVEIQKSDCKILSLTHTK